MVFGQSIRIFDFSSLARFSIFPNVFMKRALMNITEEENKEGREELEESFENGVCLMEFIFFAR